MKHVTLLGLAALLSASAHGQVIFQSGFENWSANLPTDWYGSKSNIAQSGVTQVTSDVHGGASAVRLTKASTGHQRFTTQTVSVVSGQAYEFRFWVRGQGQIRVGLFDGRAATSGYSPYNPQAFVSITGNTWQEVVLNITAEMDATNAEFILSLQSTAAPEHLVVDDVTISEVTIAPPPFHTIQEIQETAAPNGNSPLNGQAVTTSGIVTGVDTIGADGYFIQNGQGPWSGIYVFDVNHIVSIGDSLTVAGGVSEFSNKTELATVTLFTNHGPRTVPTPEALTPAAAQAEQWEGVLVKVHDIGAVNLPVAPNNEWTASSWQGTITVDDVMYLYTPIVGSYYSITGIMDQFQANYKLCPRQLSDIETGSGIGEAGIAMLGIHPNPASDAIRMDLGAISGRTEYAVTDATGRVVMSGSLTSNMLFVGELVNGPYVITLRGSDGLRQARMLVQH